MTFAVTDLMLNDELQGELNEALANAGLSEALEQCIAEAQAVVADYILGYTVADDRQKGWIRAIALFKAWSIAGSGKISDACQKAYDLALEELREVRDGKFAFPAATVSDPAKTAEWGSGDRIDIRE